MTGRCGFSQIWESRQESSIGSKAEGHDAVHLREQALQRLPNGAIFEKASAESRILLTFDLDFGEIVALSAGRTVSVVVYRLRNARTDNQIRRLQKVLAESGPNLETGAIVVLEEARHRVRHLPLGI